MCLNFGMITHMKFPTCQFYLSKVEVTSPYNFHEVLEPSPERKGMNVIEMNSLFDESSEDWRKITIWFNKKVADFCLLVSSFIQRPMPSTGLQLLRVLRGDFHWVSVKEGCPSCIHYNQNDLLSFTCETQLS